MQTESGTDAAPIEVRPSWHLYATYGTLVLGGAMAGLWLKLGSGPWAFLVVATGLSWLIGVLALGLALWGLGGIATLFRWRLRIDEQGVYQGPASGRGGVYLTFSSIQALQMDVVHFPSPIPPLVGHYRVIGEADEILLPPKLYADIEKITQTIAQRSEVSWSEVRLSRSAPNAPSAPPIAGGESEST